MPSVLVITDRAVFEMYQRIESTVERTNQAVNNNIKQSVFAETEFTALAHLLIKKPLNGWTLDEGQNALVAVARQVQGVSRAILRALPPTSAPSDIRAEVTSWVPLLVDERRSLVARRQNGETIPLSVCDDPSWWPTSFLSWQLAGKPRIGNAAFAWGNAMKHAGLAKHSAEKYVVALMNEPDREPHRQLLALKAVRDEDFVEPDVFMSAMRTLSEAQSDESVMAVLQGAERSLTAWWRARQRKSVILARPAYSPLRTAPVAVAESQHDHARPTSPMPRRQAPSPLAEGALIHRLQLDRDDRPKRHDLGVIAEVLWRNRWIGNLTVSPASLKNLLRSRASADAVGNLNTYLACLESLGLVKRRNGSVALCASPRSAAGKRIMAKLALRFPH